MAAVMVGWGKFLGSGGRMGEAAAADFQEEFFDGVGLAGRGVPVGEEAEAGGDFALAFGEEVGAGDLEVVADDFDGVADVGGCRRW